MISYVLVLIVSLATGQPTHAFVEGPMADSWCQQLIQRDGYTGQDRATFRVASCMRWPDAQLELAQNSCSQAFSPSQRTRRVFDCAVGGEDQAVEASTAVDGETPSRAVTTMRPVATAAVTTMTPTATATASATMAVPSTPVTETASAVLPPAVSLPVPSTGASASTLPRLGLAATSLVTQAHTQIHAGKYDLAEETIERALRIEPDNPVLWVELGEVWMTKGDAVQADGTSRRALALAAGDRQVQAAAWRLIAESLRARGRNQEAADANRQAITLAAQ